MGLGRAHAVGVSLKDGMGWRDPGDLKEVSVYVFRGKQGSGPWMLLSKPDAVAGKLGFVNRCFEPWSRGWLFVVTKAV